MNLANFERMYQALFSPPDTYKGRLTHFPTMDFFTSDSNNEEEDDAAEEDFKETTAKEEGEKEREQNPFIICLKGFVEEHTEGCCNAKGRRKCPTCTITQSEIDKLATNASISQIKADFHTQTANNIIMTKGWRQQGADPGTFPPPKETFLSRPFLSYFINNQFLKKL